MKNRPYLLSWVYISFSWGRKVNLLGTSKQNKTQNHWLSGLYLIPAFFSVRPKRQLLRVKVSVRKSWELLSVASRPSLWYINFWGTGCEVGNLGGLSCLLKDVMWQKRGLALSLAPSSTVSRDYGSIAKFSIRGGKGRGIQTRGLYYTMDTCLFHQTTECLAGQKGRMQHPFIPKLLRQFSEIRFEENENRAVITAFEIGVPIMSNIQLLIISAQEGRKEIHTPQGPGCPHHYLLHFLECAHRPPGELWKT